MLVKRIININLPGSKSYTNRALICAALADGRTRLFGFAECEDSLMMMKALKKMGVKLKTQNSKLKTTTQISKPKRIQKYLEVEGGIRRLRLPKGQINVGNAGTAMRFLTSLLGLIVNKVKSAKKKLKVETESSGVILTGSKRMQKRPIGDLLEALGELGIRAEAVDGNGRPPIKFLISNFKFLIKSQIQNPKSQIGGVVRLKGSTSSQYLSSILLCAPYFDRDTEIEIIGELTSKPYIDMTIDAMRQFGVKVINQKYRYFKVRAGQKYKPCDYQIEPDASAASYFMAGAALTKQRIFFPGLTFNSKQGDVQFTKLLAEAQSSKLKAQNYNLKLKTRDNWLKFCGNGELFGITADMNAMPDLVPTLAVLAMFAEGRTIIKNVANLRIKETDRLKALAVEIRKFGVAVKELRDGLEIIGQPTLRNNEAMKQLSNRIIDTYDDHRMAMAFAIAKLVLPDIIIENPECTAKSFPGFWKEWRKICIPSL